MCGGGRLSQIRGMSSKEGSLSQKKVLDNNVGLRPRCSLIAPQGMSHSRILGNLTFASLRHMSIHSIAGSIRKA
jgi:hypothetical protein